MSYGFVAPLASIIKAVDEADAKYYQCMKAGLLAHMQGYPPAVVGRVRAQGPALHRTAELLRSRSRR